MTMKKTFLALLLACSLTATAQETTDPNFARAEKMFSFLLTNQADSLYENLSSQVKSMIKREQLDGILSKLEPQMGKYQKHGAWEVQQVMGQKCYVSMVQFEKSELGALVIFDAQGKMLGIQLVPPAAVKMNHLFMEGEGKSTPLEYQTEGHVAPYVIEDVASFIKP